MMDRPFTNTGAGAETLETKKPPNAGRTGSNLGSDRGVAVAMACQKLGVLLNALLTIHKYPSTIEAVLGELFLSSKRKGWKQANLPAIARKRGVSNKCASGCVKDGLESRLEPQTHAVRCA